MPESLVQRSFAAGELAPSYHARADLKEYTQGLRTLRNFQVMKQGGATNRSGFGKIVEVKTSTNRTFLFPFVNPSTSSSYLIEAGNGYFRFVKDGAQVTVSGVLAYDFVTDYEPGDLVVTAGINYYCTVANGPASSLQPPPDAGFWYPLTGAIYEVPTPYAVADFQDPARLCWQQYGQTVRLTHLSHPPRELRYSATSPNRTWTLTTLAIGPNIAPPGGPAGVAGAAGARTFAYVVTAIDADIYEESNPSAVISVPLAAAGTAAAPIALSWSAVANAVEYRIYADPFGNGTFGYLGTATGQLTFNDVGNDGPEPDFLRTPPVPRPLFGSSNHYPAVSTVYQQRLFMGGTNTDREDVFASQTGKLPNFAIRTPLQPDDAVTFNVASNLSQFVRHLVAVKPLVMLTDNGVWVVKGGDDGVITPTAINLDEHAYVGAAFVPPVVIGNKIAFVEARATTLRDLEFRQQSDSFAGRDLTILSTHLFKGYTLEQLAFARNPDSIIWCVRSDGTLLGLTYIPDVDQWGWHRHDTGGLAGDDFEQVCVVPEGDTDAVYVIVRRSIDGSTKRTIERMARRDFAAAADARFLDSYITIVNGAPSVAVTGLSHLESRSVRVFADGLAVAGTFTVSGGNITLPTAATTVTVGLPITAQLETLDLDVAGSAVRDKRKRVVAAALLLEASSRSFAVGPVADKLKTYAKERWDQSADPFTGRVELAVTAQFTDYGRVLVQHTDPTPLTILAVLPSVDIGG